jgi:hypothetical protein
MASFSDLKGSVLVEITGLKKDSDEVSWVAEDGRSWRMYHSQDCCESVSIEDVCGDVADLLGVEILEAAEVTDIPEPRAGDDSYTWTFYRISTIKGTVVIRWLGESNGYYSESVYFDQETGVTDGR